jgi:hypothetical protein
MKKNYTTLLLLLLTFSCLMAQAPAADPIDMAQTPPLVGNFERNKDFMGVPTILMLQDGGKFELVTGTTSIIGTYIIAGNRISFRDIRGDYAATLAGEGIYEMVNTNGAYSLKCVKDKAIQRKDVLKSATWRRLDHLTQTVGN